MGTVGGLLDSEGGLKSRDLSWEVWLLIGIQLNFMAIPT